MAEPTAIEEPSIYESGPRSLRWQCTGLEVQLARQNLPLARPLHHFTYAIIHELDLKL